MPSTKSRPKLGNVIRKTARVRDILKQHPHQEPEVFLNSPAPLFLTATREGYWRMRAVREATVAAYRNAAERLRRGENNVEFPVGCFPPPAPFVRMRAPPYWVCATS